MRLYDAHNHLQDERLAPHLAAILETLNETGVRRMVVNGSRESDWPAVRELARRDARVLPSFGYHPWHVRERTPDWRAALVRQLDAVPSALGEIGLDRWILEQPDRDAAPLPEQAEVFIWQLRLAAERNRPASIHCLKAWGPLVEILRREPRPRCGFVLHSYGGPKELVAPLAALGAYFSLPGCFARERKQPQREAFRVVPPNRLLIETDAPDQLPPDARIRHPLTDAATGEPLNHPANLAAVYAFAAELSGEPVEDLALRVEENFLRLFAGL